jgi:signal transduction histidine kinase
LNKKSVTLNIEADRRAIDSISAIPLMLDLICRTTGMGFATVARVTHDRWIAYAVQDNINFGLGVGGELKVETTLCNEVYQYQKGIVIDNFAEDPQYAQHHTPQLYGLQSYISIPIFLKDGSFFGTLCAIHPKPAKVNNPEIIGMFNLYAELISLHLDNYQRLEDTETKLLEEKKTAELREQFIAILGHDLRNPVSAVRNVAQLFESGRLDENGIKRFTKVLLNSSFRMMGLIDNLMDFARGRLGSGIIINKRIQSLKEPLQYVIDELQLIWPDKIILSDIELHTDVNIDARRISQLFSNLLGNALSHGEPGQPVRIKIHQNEDVFLLSVTNNGQDIPASVLNQIFEPFARGKANADHDGLGLGLYIASEIAKTHDGMLECFSANNEIEFRLTIPLFTDPVLL